MNSREFSSSYGVALGRRVLTTPEGREVVSLHDAQSRPTRLEVPGVLPVEMAYDTRGRLSSVTQGMGS